METMQCCIQATIQLHIVATCKSMFITTINPEMTLLTALKTVLLSVSIIIEAVNYMKVCWTAFLVNFLLFSKPNSFSLMK